VNYEKELPVYYSEGMVSETMPRTVGERPVAHRRHPVEIHAFWDAEAEVWSAEAENLPGLVTEADSIDALMDKLRVMVPELLSYSPDLAARLGPDIHLVSERSFRT
jgi:Domain of unknown function (DUF1902)